MAFRGVSYNSVCDTAGFAHVRRLLLHESWSDASAASLLFCQLLDSSHSYSPLPFDTCPTNTKVTMSKTKAINAATASKAVELSEEEVSGFFFDFVVYFATSLTSLRLSHGLFSPPNSRSLSEDSSTGHAAQTRLFPPLRELWRQPSLIAALEAVAESLWEIQSIVHHSGQLMRCPLCYAAGIGHTAGTHALWTLLEFHAAAAAKATMEEGVKEPEDEAVHEAQRLLWVHGVAACRNAVWNGATHTLRMCVEDWIFSGAHSALFLPAKQGDAGGDGDTARQPAVLVGSDLHSLRGLILTLCCLLAQDETAIRLDAAEREHTTKDLITPRKEKSRKCEADDDAVSSLSVSTLSERGDTELCASMESLRDASPTHNSAVLFAVVATSVPMLWTEEVPLLHWACAGGYEDAVRLILTTWQTTHGQASVPKTATTTVSSFSTSTSAIGMHYVEEKRVRIAFDNEKDTHRCTVDESRPPISSKLSPSRTASRAIRCPPLCIPVGVTGNCALSFAARAGSVTLTRQLLLFGATRHESLAGIAPLLAETGAVLEETTGDHSLHTRVREVLCATAAADALAEAARRLREARTKAPTDSIMRLTLAALEFDPHCPIARTTMRDLLVREAVHAIDEGRNNHAPHDSENDNDNREEQRRRRRRRGIAVRRMAAQWLSDTPLEPQTERAKELYSLLRDTPHTMSGADDVSGGGESPATIATDAAGRPTYALVNFMDANKSMRRPLWLRLPRDVDVTRSLEATGGLYGVVACDPPLTAPVERGDLVLFALRRKACRLDVTGVVRPSEGVVVEIPCIRNGDSAGNVTISTLRSVMAPASVVEFGADRTMDDPLQWMESAASGDVVELILKSPPHLRRWAHMVHRGQQPFWLREVHIGDPSAAVWRLPEEAMGTKEVVFARAEFPFPADVDVEDPFGASAEAIFALRRKEGKGFRVAGVFPIWGLEHLQDA